MSPSRTLLGLLLSALVVGPMAVAQSGPFAQPWEIDLVHIHRAMTASTCEVEQVRRIPERRENNVTLVAIEERLFCAPAEGGGSRFELSFRGVENQQLTDEQLALRDAMFSSQAAAIHLDQSFRILDLEKARANYALFFVDATLRANRPCYRVVLLPRLIARSAWVLELDIQTAYPLYTAEYNALGQFAGELEVTRFRHGADARLPSGDWSWKLPSTVTEYATPNDAVSVLGEKFVVPERSVLPPGYEPHAARVIKDPLSTDRRLVLDFSDGIDQIHVIEAQTSAPPLVAEGHTVSIYHDSGLSLAHFRHASLDCTVVGRGTDLVVRYVTEGFFRQLLR